MLYLYLYIKNWLDREEGQDLIEYALIAVLISIVSIVALTALGTTISVVWEQVTNALS